MSDNIQIIEKPDGVSWEAIQNVLVRAHAENRSKGIIMRKPSLPGDEIKKEIGTDGVMLLALDSKQVVGTAALILNKGTMWYNEGLYGYCCFDAVLPEYNGKGVYRKLCSAREELARKKKLNKLYVDTHQANVHAINVNLKNGFKKVDVKILRDHWNVVLFKWIDGCPYSDFRCRYEFAKRKAIM